MKKLISLLVFIVVTFIFLTVPARADEDRDKVVDAINRLAEEIENFYLHQHAQDFLNNFYTWESNQQLRDNFHESRALKIPNWETNLDAEALDEIYHLLRSGVNGLRPLPIRRGEAVSRGQDLNFRSVPAVETQVLYWLPYGTAFEITEDTWGGPVTDEAGNRNYLWFRIRHDNQAGYVHSRYVRAIPVSEYRIATLAHIARAELWIQSKIDGWWEDYAPITRQELQAILNEVDREKSDNWQFDFTYEALNDLLQQLNYDHLNLLTTTRYRLMNDIIRLQSEIENNLQGTGNRNEADYTQNSWQRMGEVLAEAQRMLVEEWEYNLDYDDLTELYHLLRSGLVRLEEVPAEAETAEETASALTEYQRRIRQLVIGMTGFFVVLIVVWVVKLIGRLKG